MNLLNICQIIAFAQASTDTDTDTREHSVSVSLKRNGQKKKPQEALYLRRGVLLITFIIMKQSKKTKPKKTTKGSGNRVAFLVCFIQFILPPSLCRLSLLEKGRVTINILP